MTTYYIVTDACQCEVEADTLDAAAAEFAAGEGMKGVATAADLERLIERVGGWLTITDESTGDVLAEVSR